MRKLQCITMLTLLLFAASITSLSVKGNPNEVLPWGVERIGGNIVWDKYPGDLTIDPGLPAGQGIKIAVIDTGIDYNHPDLNGRVVGGTSYVPPYTNYTDEVGHGTAVAGVIAASTNGIGIVGVAPQVSLLAVKTDLGIGAVIAGIYWSVENGAKIISMSLGFENPNQLLYTAVDSAYRAGALLIAASGNENLNVIRYPARYAEVIAVGATNQNDQRWVESPTLGSNYGPELDFAAPGQNIYTTGLNGSYITGSGTSLSTPHVSGMAALFLSSKMYPPYDSDGDRQWDNFEVEQKMRDTVLDLGSWKKDDYYGYGLINAWYATQRPPADINYDQTVNILDKGFMSAHWTGAPGATYDRRADINIDNVVDIIDLGILNANWGKTDP